MSKHLLKLIACTILIVTCFLLFKARNPGHPEEVRVAAMVPDAPNAPNGPNGPKPPAQESNVGPDGPNMNQGLSAAQIETKLHDAVMKRGGYLQVWKDSLKANQAAAAKIKNVELTPDLNAFLDKVDQALIGGTNVVNIPGATISGLEEAKQAHWVYLKSHYIEAPSKAVMRGEVVYFTIDGDAEIDPTLSNPEDFAKFKKMKRKNFSRGWVIKLKEKDRIQLYDWNFNHYPPPDGVIGVETENE